MTLHFVGFVPGPMFAQAVAIYGQPTAQFAALVPAVLVPGATVVWANYGKGEAACLPTFIHYTVP